PPSLAAEIEMPPRFPYRPRRNRPLTEHRLSRLCAQRSFTPLTLAEQQRGESPAGPTGHRSVVRAPRTAPPIVEPRVRFAAGAALAAGPNAATSPRDSIFLPRVPSPRRCYKNADLPATNCGPRDQRV